MVHLRALQFQHQHHFRSFWPYSIWLINFGSRTSSFPFALTNLLYIYHPHYSYSSSRCLILFSVVTGSYFDPGHLYEANRRSHLRFTYYPSTPFSTCQRASSCSHLDSVINILFGPPVKSHATCMFATTSALIVAHSVGSVESWVFCAFLLLVFFV